MMKRTAVRRSLFTPTLSVLLLLMIGLFAGAVSFSPELVVHASGHHS